MADNKNCYKQGKNGEKILLIHLQTKSDRLINTAHNKFLLITIFYGHNTNFHIHYNCSKLIGLVEAITLIQRWSS